jgi:hypothetical protein
MSVRPPILRKQPLESGAGILDGEIMAEMAASIGRAGRALEKALLELDEFNSAATGSADADIRETLLQDTAEKAWALIIQYELSGLSTQKNLVKRYRIPAEVMVRVGVLPQGK